MQKVGLLGSGDVAKTLAAGFMKHGCEVMLGTREAAKLADWQQQNAGAQVGSFAEAAQFGPIIVLAVKGNAAHAVLASIGAEALKGKIIIDATNPIADLPPVNGVLQFFTNINKSLMEQLQQAFTEAHFVKAFSSVGNALMVNPNMAGGVRPTMFICGNDANAKAEVTTILDTFGWETEDMGAMEAARAIEPLCILWCIPGFLRNDWMHAFKVLKV